MSFHMLFARALQRFHRPLLYGGGTARNVTTGATEAAAPHDKAVKSRLGLVFVSIVALTAGGCALIVWTRNLKMKRLRERFAREEQPEWAEICVYRDALGVDPRTNLEKLSMDPVLVLEPLPVKNKTIMERLRERNPKMDPAVDGAISAVLGDVAEDVTNAYKGVKREEARTPAQRASRVVF